MKEETITISLQDFVDSHLGRNEDGSHMWFSRPVKQHIADIILAKTSNKHTCYIQSADEMSPDLKNPVLWEYKYWLQSSDLWQRQKKYSDAQRIEREIERQNVKIVAIAFEKEYGLGGDGAQIQAYKWVRTKNMAALKLIGIDKLLTKETIR